MKQKKNLWVNLLFAVVVLVIAGVLFYLRSAGQSGSTLGAELIYRRCEHGAEALSGQGCRL